MKKRKTFSKVLSEKLLISIPIILILLVITVYVLHNYSKYVLTETMSTARHRYIDKILEQEKDSSFEENLNYIKFFNNLNLETTLSSFPGIKAYMYITDSDGNIVMDSSPAWGFLHPVRDEDMTILKRDVYICDYESLCRFDEVREILADYNTVYDSTVLEYTFPQVKEYQYVNILEGYVDPETLKIYPTTVEITTERIRTWGGGYLGDEEDSDVVNVETISMPIKNTEGLLTYKYVNETNEIYIDGEYKNGIHILTGRNTTLDSYQAIARRPLSNHMTSEEYFTDRLGNEYYLTIKLTDDFLHTYLSFIIILSIVYILIDLLVCFILSNITYSNLRVWYQNEDYRKALMHSMAHDLKTPLTVMSGYAENLKENVQTEKREHYADAILENTQYMNGIILDVLNLSKVEDMVDSGKNEKIDLCDIAKATSERYEEMLAEKNLTLDIKGSFKRSANRIGIERVMDNLIGNAIKYTENGGKISIYSKDAPFSSHSLIIENSPIKPLKLNPDKLWDPFVKDDESRSEKSGTGLGLSIVRNILNGYGFKAKIKSKDNNFKIIIK
jgi:signal transduction histidine kinase